MTPCQYEIDNFDQTQTIIVASKNPVKIGAGKQGFERMFPKLQAQAQGFSIPSGVPDQPLTDEETLQGALNRAQNVRTLHADADFWMGIEGGVEAHADSYQCFAWVVVIGKDGRVGKARTAMFYQPKEIAVLVREGMELGHADDKVFGRENSKQHSGSVGLLTGDVIDRKEYYTQAVVLALIPFRNTSLTF
jgi:inosine/xanthosine triphosphatase